MSIAEKHVSVQDLARDIQELRAEVTRLKNAAPKPRLEWHLMQLVSEQENDIRRLREELTGIHNALNRESVKPSSTGTNLSPEDKIGVLEDALLKAFNLIGENRRKIGETARFTRLIWNEFRILNIIANDYMLAKHPGYFKAMQRIEDLIGVPVMSTPDSFAPLPESTGEPGSRKN